MIDESTRRTASTTDAFVSGSETYEKWVWTELLAFDNREADFGVASYCEVAGFVPTGMCLLVSSPDFVFLHDGLETEKIMSPLICSRNAHEGSEARERQVWTNWQIRDLIKELSQLGCQVYLSMFSVYAQNAHHHEWLSDHQEALGVWVGMGRGLNFNPLAMLKDGTLLEDIFIPKTVKACVDYGFAGWHGADGYGPLVTDIWGTDMSDQMIAQFRKHCPAMKMPEFMLSESHDRLETLAERARWLREKEPLSWIGFISERWMAFWKKMNAALHSENKRSIINSAWTKGNFESLFSYGIDYRKMAATGIDYMVVEAVALSLSHTYPKHNRHYEFAATMFEIKACAPGFKLLILNGIKDVVEEWDSLRHSPTGYEREIYALANMFYLSPEKFERASIGLLGCLADGITVDEWQHIRQDWLTAFDGVPASAGQVTAIWSDELLEGACEDYLLDGMWASQWQIVKLMENNVQIQCSVRLEDVSRAHGAVLLPSAHLLGGEKLDRLLSKSRFPVVLSGRTGILSTYFSKARVICDDQFAVLVFNSNRQAEMRHVPQGPDPFQHNTESRYFANQNLNRLDVTDHLFQKAAELINQVVIDDLRERNMLYAECIDVRNGDCTLNTRLLDENTIDVAIENTTPWGKLVKTIRVSRIIDTVAVISNFPLRVSRKLDDYSFQIVVPTRGVSIVRVKVSSLSQDSSQPKCDGLVSKAALDHAGSGIAMAEDKRQLSTE